MTQRELIGADRPAGAGGRRARRDPVLFLAGAFVAGLLGARFLRSPRLRSQTGAAYRPRSGGSPTPQPSLISDEAAARLLREAERAQRAFVSGD